VHRVGDIIDERYQLVRPLGRRQEAEWWEAEHEVVGRTVTLKLLNGDVAEDPDVQQKLVLESRAASEIRHRTAIEVFDVGVTQDGEAFLVTEPLRGETLSDLVSRTGGLDPANVCRIALEILGGLEAAHAAGMAHGSLASSKVILGRGDDGALVVKILDFGLDTCASDPADDIRTVGRIMREALTGRPALPAELYLIADRAIAGEIASARQMAETLAPFAAPPGCPSLAPRDSLMPFLSPEARRARALDRIEKAVQGDREPEPRSSARPNLVGLPTPEIPRPPRAPKHFDSRNERPRLFATVVSTGWTAGLLAAGITVGLLLARLLHF
jgi:serine/threonine protein kinase